MDGAQEADCLSSESLNSTFSVSDVLKVLALHNLLHNGVGVDASVVHPGGVTLHRVLLPPETEPKVTSAKRLRGAKKIKDIAVPWRPVGGQYGPRGPRRSFRTTSVLVALRWRIGTEGNATRGAASCGSVSAVREVRQAGGAGVFGAVACRVQPTRVNQRRSIKKNHNKSLNHRLVIVPDILLCWLA